MAIKYSILIFCFVVISQTVVMAQSSVYSDSSSVNSNNSILNTKANKLLNSISDNKNIDEIAENYYALALELSKEGNYAKAEIYMNKAIQTELSNKNSSKLGGFYRELAKIQEAQNKAVQASESYLKASELTEDKTQRQLNKNDANRLKYKSTPQVELQYLNQNATLLNNNGDKSEKIYNLTQMANTNIALDQNEQALENYKDALKMTDSTSEKSIIIKSDMANLLAETNNFGEAIDLQKEVVAQSEKNASVETHVKQLQNLSSLYFTTNNVVDGLTILQKAYRLAVEKGSIKEAKSSLVMLAEYYEKKKENLEVVKLYKDFIGHIETLISNDSSLIDKNIFLINEGKISQLEKEKTLKDELIERKKQL